MYKLTYESDDEQLVGDLSTKHRYKSTEVKRSRSMATKDPNIVPDYLKQTSSNEEMKYRADSSASVVMAAYPAPSTSVKNTKDDQNTSKDTTKSKARKKVHPSPPRYNLFNEPDEKKSAFSFAMCRQVLLCLYLIVLTASLVLCFIFLQSNYTTLRQLRGRLNRMETTFNDEMVSFDGKFHQLSTKQELIAAEGRSSTNDQLASDIQHLQLQLEVQRQVSEVEIKKTKQIEEKLKELEGRMEELNSTTEEQSGRMRSLLKREQEVEELILTEFNSNKKPSGQD